jgi:hypothetical protein
MKGRLQHAPKQSRLAGGFFVASDRCTVAQAIDFLEFVLHIPLQGSQWRAAPSRFRLFYNGPVVFRGSLSDWPFQAASALCCFITAVSAFSQQPR